MLHAKYQPNWHSGSGEEVVQNGSVLSQEMSFKFFMNGCHGNQSCHAIFIKASYMLSEHCL